MSNYDPFGRGPRVPYPGSGFGFGGYPEQPQHPPTSSNLHIEGLNREIEALKAHVADLEGHGKMKSLSTVVALDGLNAIVAMQGTLYEIPLPSLDGDADAEERETTKALLSKLHIG